MPNCARRTIDRRTRERLAVVIGIKRSRFSLFAVGAKRVALDRGGENV